MTAPKPGDVVLIGPTCSVQFNGNRALRIRLVSIGAVDPYHGWVWLTGYVLDAKGMATDKRDVYVRSAGITVAQRRDASTPAVRTVPGRARTAVPSRARSAQN
ncbi:hypothetical protein [Micromonospora tarensis]|uniref:Uncharacterized protein n=1 Tax=Micromonospora tarensis TaxID=2806100 RepID=A0ABS1YJ72_9ACTN|nr:hypothetical protein [Micromonospora tarensis]MBM0277433.1 hypothetical protein [Micromonospora tarensis]